MIKGKKGGILIYMLGMVTLLSIVVTEFLLETASAMRFRSQMSGREDLELIADSALESSVAILGEMKELDKGLFSPAQGWGDPLKYFKFPVPEGYSLKVTIHDESGKLSIYEDKLDNFGNLLIEMGISFEIVSNLKRELREYLDKLKKATPGPSQSSGGTGRREPERPEANAPGNPPANADRNRPQNEPQGGTSNEPNTQRPNNRNNRNGNNEEKKKVRTLFTLEQLKEIPVFERTFFDEKGNPNELFKTLKQNVSVLNTGKVNINTAPALVKKILIGTQNTNIPGKKYLTSMRDLRPTGAQSEQNETNQNRNENEKFDFHSTLFDIEIEVARGPIKYHLGAILEDDKPRSEERESRPEQNQEATQGQGNQTQTPRGNARNTQTPPSRESQNNRPNSELRTSPSGETSKQKNNFSFLALTEDNSFIN